MVPEGAQKRSAAQAPRACEVGYQGWEHGANFRCLVSGAPISGEYIKAEGIAGRMGTRLMAVVVQEGRRSRVYLDPDGRIWKTLREPRNRTGSRIGSVPESNNIGQYAISTAIKPYWHG